jgi:integrase
MGSLYRPKLKDWRTRPVAAQRSTVWWVKLRQLDLEAGTLRLDPGTTKNDEGRLVYLTPELARLLGEQLERIRALERKTGRIIPALFPYLRGRRRVGQPRRDFRKAWETACRKAGVPGRLRHGARGPEGGDGADGGARRARFRARSGRGR